MFTYMLLFVVLAAVAILFFALKRERFGKKPLIGSAGLFLILLISLFVVGGQPEMSESEYKAQAKVFSFERYQNDDVEQGTVVKVSGEVILINDDIYVLDTSDGAFYVKNSAEATIQEGENLTVYGGYSGKDSTGSPAVNGHYVER